MQRHRTNNTPVGQGENTREDFCGACLTIPLAMAGVGMGAVGSGKRGNHKKLKKIALWVGLFLVLLSILISIYFIYIRKCSDCR